jgi:Tricorn protease C1 domain
MTTHLKYSILKNNTVQARGVRSCGGSDVKSLWSADRHHAQQSPITFVDCLLSFPFLVMRSIPLLYAALTLLTLQATTSWSIPRLQGVNHQSPPADHRQGNYRRRIHLSDAARVLQDAGKPRAFSVETMALSAIIGLTVFLAVPAASFGVDLTAVSLRHPLQPAVTLVRPPAGANKYQSYSPPTITLSAADDHVATSLLDEVWTLIDKYYIDRSFGGNDDWNKVLEKYTPLVQNANDEGTRYRLVTEMVGTLGDKYSRMLDPAAYVAIQKYDLIGVGVTLAPNDDKDIIVGAPPIAGSEADRVGIRQGDFITAINGIQT